MMSCYMYSLMHACIPYRSHAHAQDLILASSAGSSLAVTITIIVDTSAQVYGSSKPNNGTPVPVLYPGIPALDFA